jgi:transcriptional regulator with XRE-family HTH domain
VTRRRPYAERTFHLAGSVVKTIPSELAKRRLERGISQRQASREIGIPNTTLRRIEAGQLEEAQSRHLSLILQWLGGNQPT